MLYCCGYGISSLPCISILAFVPSFSSFSSRPFRAPAVVQKRSKVQVSLLEKVHTLTHGCYIRTNICKDVSVGTILISMFNEHNLNLSEFVLQGLFPNILPAGKSVHAPVNVGASTPSTTCKFHQAAAVATGRKTMYSMHMYDHILSKEV